MKKKSKILLLIVLLLLLTHVILDRELAYYGRSSFDFKVLPLNMSLEFRYDFQGGTALLDDYGFHIAGRGVSIQRTDILIEQLLEYGFADNVVVAKVKDNKDQIYFVEFTPIQVLSPALWP